jgi:sulfatase maturation enzyme AslB (radical SAM superfamily)
VRAAPEEEGGEEAVGRGFAPPAAAGPPWALRSLFLVTTSACNLRCAYCYNPRGAGAAMGRRVAEAAVARLWASPEREVNLLITGGEPLLDFAAVRRIVELARRTRPRGRSVSIALLTNGTRLGEAQANYLARRRVAVQISFDGVEAAQRLRGARTFARLDTVVSRLRARHRTWFRNRVSAAMTLVPGTIPSLAESIDYLLGLGFADISLSPAMGDLRGWREDLEPALDEQFARVYRSSLRLFRRTGRVPLSLFRKTQATPYPPSSARCGAEIARMAVVDVDGQVYGCPPVIGSAIDRPEGLLASTLEAMRIGHISDPDLERRLPAYREALERVGLFDRRDAYRSPFGACRDCAYLRYCDLCPLSIALAPGASDPTRVPGFACAFKRVSLKYRHRFPRQAEL